MEPVRDDEAVPQEWMEFNDRIWGRGNWDRCRREVNPCRDSFGNLAFHHLKAHAPDAHYRAVGHATG